MTELTERQRLFSELKAELFKRQLSNAENFDKAILTYASGALGISLTFLKDAIPLAKASLPWLLFASWWIFAAAIASTVISFLVSQLGLQKQQELAENYYLNNDESALKARNQAARATDRLNWLSGTLFCVGILFTTAFFVANAKEASMSNNRNHGWESSLEKIVVPDFQKGAPVPTMTPVPSSAPSTAPTQQPTEPPASTTPNDG